MNFQVINEQNIIASSKNKILIINGQKNTGKSVTGLLRAVHLIQNNNDKVLYLTFTKRAAQKLNEKLNSFFDNTNGRIQIMNMDKVLINIYLNSIGNIEEKIIMPNGKIVNDFINNKINEDDNITPEEAVVQINKILDEGYLTIDDYLKEETEINNITKKKKIWFMCEELKGIVEKENYIFLLDLYKDILNTKKEIKTEYKTKDDTFIYNHIIIDNIEDLSQTRYNLFKKIFKILFYRKSSTITLIGDLNAETFLHSHGIKDKIEQLKTNKQCKSFELNKIMKNINIGAAEKLAEEYGFLNKNICRHEKITEINDVSVYFIKNMYEDKEYENIAKIIAYLKLIGYSYNDINIISFSRNSLENLEDQFNELYNIPIYYDNPIFHSGEYDLNYWQLERKKRYEKESFKNYEEEKVEIMTAHNAQKNWENKVIILFDTITLDIFNSEDTSDEMIKKRMILLYETLYSSTDLLFIFGNNDNCSCINKLNKEYMECVEKIEDISLFDGINIDYNYLKELSFDEYIKQCFKGNYEQFEKYCDQKKQHVIFDISDAYKNEENYYSDVDIAETIKEAQKKIFRGRR